MDLRPPKEDVIPETPENSDEDTSDFEDLSESSSDEDDGPILFRFSSHSESDEEWDQEASQSPEKRSHQSNNSCSATFNTRKSEKRESRCLPDGAYGSSEEDVFRPVRTPGPHLKSTASYSPLQLFQLFLSDATLQTVVANTNAHGAMHQEGEKPWINISLNDMYSYVAMLLYLGLQRCLSVTDFWRTTKIHDPEYPSKIMSYEMYSLISATLHLNDPMVDAENDTKRGTSAYDRLCKIKPMFLELRDACKTHFHPYQNISINERVVSTNPRTGLEEYMKCKTTKFDSEYTLFGLSDSLCGYNWDFFICERGKPAARRKGVKFESAVALVDEKLLGDGYKLHIDRVHSSSALFRDLQQKKIRICESLQFNGVQKRSTTHRGTGWGSVRRRMRATGGQKNEVAKADSVAHCKRCKNGVDVSDALFDNYTVAQKTTKWYRAFFYYFVDVGVVNAFINHQLTTQMKNQKALKLKAFRKALVMELVDFVSQGGNVSP